MQRELERLLLNLNIPENKLRVVSSVFGMVQVITPRYMFFFGPKGPSNVRDTRNAQTLDWDWAFEYTPTKGWAPTPAFNAYRKQTYHKQGEFSLNF